MTKLFVELTSRKLLRKLPMVANLFLLTHI
jgi:hypothetical protein